MRIRSLATLAVLVALPAGILTTAAVSSAGATQGITHVRVAEAGANRAVPVNRAVPGKAHCLTENMNRAHTIVNLKCEGNNVSAGSAATAAAQITRSSNTRNEAAAIANGGHWHCVPTGNYVVINGQLYAEYSCTWVPGGGGGS